MAEASRYGPSTQIQSPTSNSPNNPPNRGQRQSRDVRVVPVDRLNEQRAQTLGGVGRSSRLGVAGYDPVPQ